MKIPKPVMHMRKSEEVNELFSALSNFQEEVPNIPKTKTVKVKTSGGGKYDFSYAPLEEIINKTKDARVNNGLTVTQLVGSDSQVTTILGHESGQYIQTTAAFTDVDVSKAQAVGSTITYLRRYSYEAILGLSASDDHDANIADDNTIKSSSKKKSKKKSKSKSKQQQSLGDVEPADVDQAQLEAAFETLEEADGDFATSTKEFIEMLSEEDEFSEVPKLFNTHLEELGGKQRTAFQDYFYKYIQTRMSQMK